MIGTRIAQIGRISRIFLMVPPPPLSRDPASRVLWDAERTGVTSGFSRRGVIRVRFSRLIRKRQML